MNREINENDLTLELSASIFIVIFIKKLNKMGNNSMCCQNNSSPNLDLDQITFTHPTSTTFLSFISFTQIS